MTQLGVYSSCSAAHQGPEQSRDNSSPTAGLGPWAPAAAAVWGWGWRTTLVDACSSPACSPWPLLGETWPCRLQGGPVLRHVISSGPGQAAAPQMCPQRGLPAARPAPLGWDCGAVGERPLALQSGASPLVTGDYRHPLHILPPELDFHCPHSLSAHPLEKNKNKNKKPNQTPLQKAALTPVRNCSSSPLP